MITKRLRDVLNADLGPITFSSFLRGARTSRDLSQIEMADLLGISKSSLCDIEKGRQLVTPFLATKVAKKCGLSETVAFENSVERSAPQSRFENDRYGVIGIDKTQIHLNVGPACYPKLENVTKPFNGWSVGGDCSLNYPNLNL